jgi:hypothetical protein
MRIGSTLFFAVAAISISETINIAVCTIGGDRVWLASLLVGGPFVTSIVCSYVGFRLFRNGM